MNENDIDVLLVKYDEGNTSLEEEKVIYDYMQHNPMHERALWFLAKAEFSNEKSDLTPADFKKRTSKILWFNNLTFRIAASLLLAGASAVWLFLNTGDNFISISSNDTLKQITLPDGSVVTLNKNTIARYSSNFNNSRDFWLDSGEAFFEVVKDPDRPFLVFTKETTTQVLGTSFNVNAEPNIIELTVVSGKVSFSSVENDSQMLTLTQGMSAAFNAQIRELKPLSNFDGNKLAWMTHKLEFKDMPLSSVLNTLENYFDIQIEIPDTTLLTCRFRGVFENADLEQIIQVIDYSLNVKLLPNGSTYILSGNGCNQ